MITQELFEDESVAPETHAFLSAFKSATEGAPTVIDTPVLALREARAEGSAALPVSRLDTASTEAIVGTDSNIELRLFGYDNGHGVYLHFHGGGFVMGAPDQQDVLLDAIARETGMTVISAGYRLAPEHPYPAAPDDCVTAAQWVIANIRTGRFRGPLAIGGESAGAYLAVSTLLRFREMGLLSEFAAAVLNFGVYDLGLSPSARNWGDRYAIISTPIMHKYVDLFVPGCHDLRSPSISPFYADLKGMPPALFSVGTLDPLVDDSVLMSQRWISAGSPAELSVYPGGIHGFVVFPILIAEESVRRQVSYLRAVLDTSS